MEYYRTCPDCGKYKKSPLPTPTKAPGNEPHGNANSIATQYYYNIPAGMTQEVTRKRRCAAREN